MTKNYIHYRIMKSTTTEYKFVLFMYLKINNNYRSLSQIHTEKIDIDHFDKNNNTMWLYNKNNKIINNFELTDYEVKKIDDNNKFIKYRDLS